MTCGLLHTLPSRRASWIRRTSPGLSSTSKISIGRAPVGPFMSGLPPRGNGEKERRPLTERGFYPDAAAVTLDDLLAEREANPGARVRGARVQPLEQPEDVLEVLRI